MKQFLSMSSMIVIALHSIVYAKVLPIPPLASYTVQNGVKVFDMNIHASTTQLFTGINTRTYGVNRSILGETIRIHNGDQVKINWSNRLSEPTTMHGHGMHVPAIMDGGPKNKIQPNTTWQASYTVNQSASTNWYHPHLMGKTAEHVYMGLAGMIIVDDDNSDTIGLPKTYGVDDIPLIIQDKRFTSSKQIDYSPSRMEIMRGYTSSTMLVNGAITPYVNVKDSWIRFRVLNASNSSLYDLVFSDSRSFKQIATDGGLLEKPVTLNHLLLTPGERAEILVNFSGDLGSSIVLKENRQNIDMMNININSASAGVNVIPSKLNTLVRYPLSKAKRTRNFVLNRIGRGPNGHMAINGKTMNINRIDEVVPINSVEIWNITNSMGMEHNFHIHATHFQIIERDGSSANVSANEKGYKDVVHVPPFSSVKVIVKMEDYIDSKNGYMYHCHFLEHEDDGMMGQFTVVQNPNNPVVKWAPIQMDDILTFVPIPL